MYVFYVPSPITCYALYMPHHFGCVFSAQPSLLSADIIRIEADCEHGMHAYTIVGLAGKAVEEARDRVGAALKNNGFSSPRHSQKKTIISLSPADVKKDGPLFDVPIALAYLLATGELVANSTQSLFVGELGLDGTIRPVNGILQIVIAAHKQGFTDVYIPLQNCKEAALVNGIKIWGVSTLPQLIAHLRSPHEKVDAFEPLLLVHQHTTPHQGYIDDSDVLEHIIGHEHAKRGLIIAASGGHNIALWGPPGTGKTLLASSLRQLLPPLTHEEKIEATSIHSIAGVIETGVVDAPPYRAPHHTASYVAVVGGGTHPRPGEVTLAHRGVLFLDEFPEFDKKVINALREPLEDGKITISRAKSAAQFPSRFILIAAMNPCPCGHGHGPRCTCTPLAIQKYQQKISGPIIDRIDMWIEIPAIESGALMRADVQRGATQRARADIRAARTLQRERYASSTLNAHLNSQQIKKYITLNESAQNILSSAAGRMSLSPRGIHRVMKLAQTIADLAQASSISDDHVLEALQYRATF